MSQRKLHPQQKNNVEEIIIDLPDMIQKTSALVRTLVPEKRGDNNDDNDKNEDDNDKNEDDNEEKVNTPCDPIIPPKRKTRTKKMFRPTEEMFDELIKSLCDLREISRKIITLTRETQKSSKKEVKELNAKIKKEKNEKPERKPRGFALPSPISNEMVDYLLKIANISQIERKINDQSTCPIKIEYGCLLARNELTSALCNHFRNSKMRKTETDKRDIHLDEVTTKLFGIDIHQFAELGGRLSADGEPIITYFDLQKYLPKHCGKQAVGH